jgi:hypothetical protein
VRCFVAPFNQPGASPFDVDAGVNMTQRSRLIVDEFVAGGALAAEPAPVPQG